MTPEPKGYFDQRWNSRATALPADGVVDRLGSLLDGRGRSHRRPPRSLVCRGFNQGRIHRPFCRAAQWCHPDRRPVPDRAVNVHHSPSASSSSSSSRRSRTTPWLARDRSIKLPREELEQINPPSAADVEAVFWPIPAKHRLALLWLDWSGARVSSIDHTLVGDYDESCKRVRLRASTTKTRRALWVELHPVLAETIEATRPHRRFRDPRRLCSPSLAPTRSGRRSRKPAGPEGSRSGARTTSRIAGSACCTRATSPGRGSRSSSASAT